jgi:serine/alanine adding enzyme
MDNSATFASVKSEIHASGHETLLAGDPSDFSRWDRLVDSSPTPDVYYRPGYVLANEASGLGHAIAALLSTRRQRFLCTFLKRPLPEFSNGKRIAGFDVATPYGYGGVLPLDFAVPDDTEIQELLDALRTWCLREGIVSCYLRLHPMMDQMRWAEGIGQRADARVLVHCPTIAIDLSPWDALNDRVAGMNRRRRRDLTKARQELTASWSTSGIEQFQQLYARSMDRLQAKSWCRFSPEYYQVLTSRLSGKWHFFSIHRRERLVGMALNLFDSLYLHGHLLAITEEGMEFGASTLYYNESAAWARSNGLKGFHLGSAGRTAGDSLDEFKSSFGGTRHPCLSVGFIADRDAYVSLDRLRRRQSTLPEPQGNFFPSYRA